MNLSLGQLLYAYSYHDLDIDERHFYDKDVKEFIRAMKRMPNESIKQCSVFGDISPEIISKEAFVETYNAMVFTPLVNEKCQRLKELITFQHDWAALAEEFPEAGTQCFRINNIKNPMDLVLEDVTFYSFFPEWDKGFRGLRDDDFIVYFAPPKTGKSTITAYFAYEAIKAGIPIGVYPTELTITTTLKYIFGYEFGLRGDEALAFFDGFISENGIVEGSHKEEFKELLEKYNHLIFMPPTNRFNWNDYEALYESDAKFIFHDNFIKSLSQLGLGEDATSASQFARKLSDTQHKFQKTTFLVTQEAMREATPKELETAPTITEYGKGHTFLTRSLLQESSLALHIKRRPNTQIRDLIVKNDRFRGLNDGTSTMFAEVTNRGKIRVTMAKDSVKESLMRAERKLFESASITVDMEECV